MIALDAFLQGASSDPDDDRLLRESIARSGRVVFGQRWLRKGRDLFTRPNDPFFAAGVFLWLVYGLMLGSWPIVVANAITLALAIAILAMKVRWAR